MAGRSLVFLGICLMVAVSQSRAGNDFNGNDGDNQNDNNANSNNNFRTNNNNNGDNGNNNNFRTNKNGNNNNGDSGSGGNSNRNNNGGNNNNNNNNNNRNNNNRNNNNFCKALEKRSRSVTFNCTSNTGDAVSCTERIPNGVKAKLACKKNYVVQDETMIPEMICSNGQWSRELKAFKCLSVPIATGYNYSVGVGFYKFYKSGRKWDEAKRICENDGGHLLFIDTPEERDFVNSTMSGIPLKVRVSGGGKNGGNKTSKGGKIPLATSISAIDDVLSVFVGISDMAADGVMMSVTNVTMPGGWCDAAKSEKNIAIKKRSKNCITMRPGSLCYLEVPCTYKRSFICEIEPKSNETVTSTSDSVTTTMS